MAPQRRANQSDIAERLGVSVSTVSRALANEIGISDAVRRDVQRTARALGYKSKHGNGPAGGKRAVALVPLGSATSGLSGFYFGIVEGMRAQAAEAGMVLDVRLVNESVVTLELIKKQLLLTNSEGVLLAGIDAWDGLVQWSAEADCPVVLVNGADPKMQISGAAPANFYGAFMATQRLIDAGHRQILHYGQRHRATLLQRQRGFQAAIAANPGVTGKIVYNSECPTAQLLADLLAGIHDVTAVFSWNDIAAVEMLGGLYAPDSPLPKGFSIIGFDDLPLAGIATPRLSTIGVDREAIGRSAVRLLMQQMDGERAVQQVETGVSMVDGETVFSL
ncbi:LacI family transcriptional regulator [Devosia yakushimensis]|uniref:LacI family transcriptional regulator n=1 Tax=Devosia yakushimensis TaxID=470028 RepID=A0ABQ5U869_9HYPH|nr:LacI family DNA-binding transcriptional regulator [Devosia yakushimensis]GLQ08314.1 LacI family transcriptional regulator [Devosia yakushimensis]